jgi:hypothetical protein
MQVSISIMTEASGSLVAGRYRLTGLVGQGGMGRVWRCRDELLDREVAVKEILLSNGVSTGLSHEAAERAIREARAAARLRHPSIITIYDVVMHDEKPWIIMEFIGGRSLAQEIATRGRLDWEQVARIGAALADALGHAHIAGIVHRDLKPANVLLAADRIVITDFGIARILDESVRLTSSAVLVGTPQYMPPEQLDGELVQAPGDMWALGATLYTAVEGHPPFEGQTLSAVWSAILIRPLPRPQYADALAPILSDLMTKEPGQRPDAQAAGARLAVLRKPQSPTAQAAAAPAPASTAAARGIDDSPWPRTETFPHQAGGPATPAAPPSPLTARTWALRNGPDLIADMAFSPDGHLIAACDRYGNLGIWDTATGALLHHQENGIRRPGHTGREVLFFSRAIAFSPDGHLLALASHATVQVWDPASGERRNTLSIPKRKDSPSNRRTTSLSFTPDGNGIVAFLADDMMIGVWDSSGKGKSIDLQGRDAAKVRHEVIRFQHPILASSLRLDTNSLVTISNRREVHLWNPMSGRPHRHITATADSEFTAIALSRDGCTLAIAVREKTLSGWNNMIQLIDCRTGKNIVTFGSGPHNEIISELAFHGPLLAGLGANLIKLWHARTGRHLESLEPYGNTNATCLAFSHNGNFLASGNQVWELARLPTA